MVGFCEGVVLVNLRLGSLASVSVIVAPAVKVVPVVLKTSVVFPVALFGENTGVTLNCSSAASAVPVSNPDATPPVDSNAVATRADSERRTAGARRMVLRCRGAMW